MNTVAHNHNPNFNIYRSLQTFGEEFIYGKTDCCQLARHVIKDRLGVDFGDKYDYDDELGAEELLYEYGGVEGVITDALGFPPSDIWHESDLVHVDLRDTQLIGVVVRDNVVVMAEHGLLQIKTRFIVNGWCLCHKP